MLRSGLSLCSAVCLFAVSALGACDAAVVVNAPAAGGTGGTTGATDASSGQGGALLASTATGQGGGAANNWEHSCRGTGLDIGDAHLDSACPDDFWSLEHYDGATAYDTAAGFTGDVTIYACDRNGLARVALHVLIDGVGSGTLTGAEIRRSDGDRYQLTTGILDVWEDGDVGEVIYMSFEGSFAPVDNDGPPIEITGSGKACHLPRLSLP